MTKNVEVPKETVQGNVNFGMLSQWYKIFQLLKLFKVQWFLQEERGKWNVFM